MQKTQEISNIREPERKTERAREKAEPYLNNLPQKKV